MNLEEFYSVFPGTIILKENRGWYNFGYCQYLEFQYYPSENTLEVCHTLEGSLTDEIEISFEDAIKLIEILKNSK